ncbi:MAG: hypothetical protein ABR521_08935 [Gaiellaceae bacterium]
MLTGLLVDPRVEGVPDAWERFLTAESVPGTWHGTVLGRLAWLAQAPSYLGVVLEGSGTPWAIFHLRHLGASLPRHAFVGPPTRPAAPGLVECRLPPTGSGTGYRFASGLDAGERSAALAAIERTLAARLGRRASAIVYRNVPAGDLASFPRGRICRRVTPEVVVDNRWDDLEAFYADLPSKQRSELRRLDHRLSEGSEVVVATERTVEPACASRLAASVVRRHRHRLRRVPPIPASYFDALGGRAGIEFLTYREGEGRLLSFATLVDDGSELSDSVWGSLDVRDGGRPHLYFHHYLRAIRLLISRRRRRITLGKGLGRIKLRYAGRYERRHVVGAVL